MNESTVTTGTLSEYSGQKPRTPHPPPEFAGHVPAMRIPNPLAGTELNELWWTNGVGTGLSVYHSSGQTLCVPWLSLRTSNATVPVRPPEISNGCLGYMARFVTPVWSNTASTTWP